MNETEISLLVGGGALLLIVVLMAVLKNGKGASDTLVDSGDGFIRRGEPDNAIKSFRKAIDKGKYKKYSRVIAQTKLARCFFDKGDYETAESLLVECLRLSSTDRPSRLLLGELFYETKRYDEAILHFNEYLETLPDKDAYFRLALSYAKKGLEKEANIAANHAIELKYGSGSSVRREVKKALATAKNNKESK